MKALFTADMKSWLIIIIVYLLIISHSVSAQNQAVDSHRYECVILLHGLARTSSSMEKLENAFRQEGYTVTNIDYPSRHNTIEELSESVVHEGVEFCRKNSTKSVHFITHSLGGILVRYYLSTNKIPELGRVVMLAPPNQGSNVVNSFSGYPGYEWINGPAGYQLGKDDKSIPLQLGPADFEVGIIAGDRTINPILSTAFDGPNDGKVAVKDTRLAGMKDFLVVHHSHPFILESDEVVKQAMSFIRYGKFRVDHE